MKSLGYLGAFFGGALAGAVIGLLLAPEKGEDTRTKITEAVDDFMKNSLTILPTQLLKFNHHPVDVCFQATRTLRLLPS